MRLKTDGKTSWSNPANANLIDTTLATGGDSFTHWPFGSYQNLWTINLSLCSFKENLSSKLLNILIMV